jgi:hypothetical protein
MPLREDHDLISASLPSTKVESDRSFQFCSGIAQMAGHLKGGPLWLGLGPVGGATCSGVCVCRESGAKYLPAG